MATFMDAANQQQPSSSSKRVVGRPFVPGKSGNPSGMRRLTAEDRERRRQAQLAHDRVVHDVAAELRRMIGPALDRLRQLIDADDDGVALRAATDLINRVHGQPVATTLVHATVAPAVRTVTPELLRASARALLEQPESPASAPDAPATPVALPDFRSDGCSFLPAAQPPSRR